MATRFSDIFADGNESEVFYIEGSQIKEAWIDGECIWALGADVKKLYWLGIHAGAWYLMYQGQDNKYYVGKGAELNVIDVSIEIPFIYESNDNFVGFLCDECVVVINRATLAYNQMAWIDYDLQEVNPIDTLILSKCYSDYNIVIGRNRLCTASQGSISVRNYISKTLEKTITLNNNEWYTITTDGSNLIWARYVSADDRRNKAYLNRLNLQTLEQDLLEINLFSLHEDFYIPYIADYYGSAIDPSTIQLTYVYVSIPSASRNVQYCPSAVDGKILLNLDVQINGTAYVYSEGKVDTVWCPTKTFQYVVSASGAIFSIKEAENYPSGSSTIGNGAYLNSFDSIPAISLFYGGLTIAGFSGISGMMTEYEGYNYIFRNTDNKLYKTKINKEVIDVNY